MPLKFDTKEFYLFKLEEFLDKEAQIERLGLETIAETNVAFEFEERLKIYCKMRLRVPKTHQQHLREHGLLRVVIPVLNDPDTRNPTSYVGTGTIKKVLLRAGDPLLTLIFQLDIVDPESKKPDQRIPKSKIQYGQTLDLRMVYDS